MKGPERVRMRTDGLGEGVHRGLLHPATGVPDMPALPCLRSHGNANTVPCPCPSPDPINRPVTRAALALVQAEAERKARAKRVRAKPKLVSVKPVKGACRTPQSVCARAGPH